MLSKSALMVIGLLLLISCSVYVGTLFRVVSLLKRNYVDYWKRIGAPSLFDANSITTVFPKIIIGRDLPTEAVLQYRLLLWALRASLLIGVVIWAFLMVMIYLGRVPK